MSKLELILGTALMGVSTAYAYTMIGVVKYIRRERKLIAEMQEQCDQIKEIMQNEEESY